MSVVDGEQEEAPFIYVSRKSRRTVRASKASNGFTYSGKPAPSSDQALKRAETNVDLLCRFLRPDTPATKEAFSATLQEALERIWSKHEVAPKPVPTKIVCLGLGAPTTSRSAQIQLSLLIILREFLSTRTSTQIDCIAFDPVFSKDDVALLARYGVEEATSESIETHYVSIDKPTLLYMPHCDRALYEEVLRRNTLSDVDQLTAALDLTLTVAELQSSKTLQWLANVTLLANTLTNYVDAAPKKDHGLIPTLARLAPKMHVVALPNWMPNKSQQIGQIGQLWDTIALNEMSFQWI